MNGQLASIGWPSNAAGAYPEIQYVYSGAQNNGQITQEIDTNHEGMDQGTISYQYDQLKRLTSSALTQTIGTGYTPYTQTFQYDGFGNLTAKVTNGTTTTIAVNATTNQLTSAYYDANGNMTSGAGATFTYDEANRVSTVAETSGGEEYYGYDAANKRIYVRDTSASEWFTFYGADGKKLGKYQISGTGSGFAFSATTTSVWFGGRLIMDSGSGSPGFMYQDRLGSNRTYGMYNPFGEGMAGNDNIEFATYLRDSYSGLDYANQRFYASTYGRFNTPDPYKGGAKGASNPKNPGSWNRYSYVKGDPINRRDPNGTCDEPTATSVTVCDTFSLLDLQPVLSWPGDGYFSGSEVSSQVAGAINNAVGQAQAAALAGLITWELAQAVQLDEQVLDNNPLCDSVIGTGIGADGTVYSPSTVLQDIYSKTAFGVFVPTDILNGDNAQAIYPGNYTLFGYTGNVVQIDINDLPGSTFNPTAQTPIFGTAAITQAVTILHELGHAMNYLFGVGQIAPDGGNNPLSNANTQLIQQKCFPGVEGGAN